MKLTSGVTITGRVLKDGKPLAGVGVGLKSVDSSENGVGNFSIATGPDGRFNFVNIPPYKNYYIYGLMESIKSYGSLRSSQVRVKGDGSKKDVGTLLVGPGLRLRGQVMLSDGQSLPPGTQLLLTLDQSWDSTLLTLEADGRFAFEGVPRGPVKLNINVPGYRLSSKNSSRALWNGDWLVGRLDRDLEGLRILLEPGKFELPDANGPTSPAGESQPEGKPLRGAESAER